MDKIDFVISWVDSADPEWQQKKQAYSGKKVVNSSNGAERFRDYGTLRYLLRSIDMYAKWVHHIYLVTDNQRPRWLDDKSDRLTVIDHQDIIPNKALPTFNSSAIELCLDNIPGLSEHFVYFNDDFLINRQVTPNDFFKNGLSCDYRIYSRLIPNSDFDHILLNDTACINRWLQGKTKTLKGMFTQSYGLRGNIKNILQLILNGGKVSHYALYHNAYSLTKTEFRQVKTLWNSIIEHTIMQQFRTKDDVNIYLLRYYRLELGKFSPRTPNFDAYYTLNDMQSLTNELDKPKHYLICVNDANTIDYANKKSSLVKTLNKKFSEQSSFER